MSQEYTDRASQVIEIEMAALAAMRDSLDDSFSEAVELCVAALELGGKLVIVGVGKSGNISHKLAATMNSTGSKAVVLNAQNALHGDLGIVSAKDVVIALSYSGETREMLELLPYLKREVAHIISITGKKESSLAKYSDVHLWTPVEREACPLGLAPTSSSTAALVMGDALAMVLLQARGFSESDFAKYHPGGSLGKALLTKVHEIMRTADRLAIASPDALVDEAIVQMSSRRAGACAVADADGVLLGIFTHGDFARSYQADVHVGKKAISELMTPKPIVVDQDALAAEALNIIQEKHIDDLLVVDGSGKVVGLVDSQDLAKHKLV